MIINPFKFNNKIDNESITNDIHIDNKIGKNNEIDELVIKIREYVINNYIELLKEDYKDKLKEKLYKDIYEKFNIKDEEKIEYLINILIDKMFGYGILQKYIDDEEISDIRVVAYDRIFIKKLGKWEKVDESFISDDDFNEYIRYCALKNNSNVTYDVPVITISDKVYNLRIEIGIEPVNVFSSSLIIRIHRAKEDINLETLFLVYNMLDSRSYKIIIDAINQRKNIILSGKGGSGKTTLLREIIKKLPDTLAICINEETAELNIKSNNVIQREVLENREHTKKVTLEKLMKQSLVMSNDVIVVGEMKGKETSVFIDAIGTGHIGYATVHSDSASNTINRLITLFKRDERVQTYKEEFVKKILEDSIDYIIYLKEYKVDEIMSKNNDGLYSIVYERKKI